MEGKELTRSFVIFYLVVFILQESNFQRIFIISSGLFSMLIFMVSQLDENHLLQKRIPGVPGNLLVGIITKNGSTYRIILYKHSLYKCVFLRIEKNERL